MDQVPPQVSLSLHTEIGEIPPADWDGCAGVENPFVSHGFLAAMEASGSVGGRTGWLPRHAVLRDDAGRVLAVAPAYAKLHSYGEYVFDHGWANALEQAGGKYYPKLLVGVPFSPVPGPRLLCRPGLAAVMAGALVEAARDLGCSGVHVNFCQAGEWETLGQAGWLQRLGTQFHWENAGYGNFDDFLAALSSRKRKSIRRERRDAAEGLEIRALRGGDISAAHWRAFYQFYLSTTDRKWGGAYLTESFFPLMGSALGEAVVLMMAFRAGRPIAGALNLLGTNALYGRNWGATEDVPFLHFELCYYQAIEFAIAHGLARVEAGAQGEHKIQRGYLPKPTYSAHYLFSPGLRRAVADFLVREREGIIGAMDELSEASPFKSE
ncbi:MAG: GNAT family N-acetyltransferase [Rhodospirillales bacterium 20-60-12]|nr:MAG: GNAT family N-acetyltransferase [Rhodospirillales bacterium 20-60-12]HQT66306.1 GNAT family N-acetyltransferase [Acetobacteraceae bacterium]